jgi:hypothetical protein
MEGTHLAWLRIAHVIANAPNDDCVKELPERPSRKDWRPPRAAFMTPRSWPLLLKVDSLTRASQSDADLDPDFAWRWVRL